MHVLLFSSSVSHGHRRLKVCIRCPEPSLITRKLTGTAHKRCDDHHVTPDCGLRCAILHNHAIFTEMRTFVTAVTPSKLDRL